MKKNILVCCMLLVWLTLLCTAPTAVTAQVSSKPAAQVIGPMPPPPDDENSPGTPSATPTPTPLPLGVVTGGYYTRHPDPTNLSKHNDQPYDENAEGLMNEFNQLGVRWIRMEVDFDGTEEKVFQKLAAKARAKGIRVIIVLAAAFNGKEDENDRPFDPACDPFIPNPPQTCTLRDQLIRNYITRLHDLNANVFNATSEFGDARIDAFEITNEPNLYKGNGQFRFAPTAFAWLLRKVWDWRSAYAGVNIISGGTLNAYSDDPWLSAFYASQAFKRYPGERPFHYMGVHPYHPHKIRQGCFNELPQNLNAPDNYGYAKCFTEVPPNEPSWKSWTEILLKQMAANVNTATGTSDTRLFVTEFGWQTPANWPKRGGTNVSPCEETKMCVNDDKQASDGLREAVDAFNRSGVVVAALWYNYRDNINQEERFGLRRKYYDCNTENVLERDLYPAKTSLWRTFQRTAKQVRTFDSPDIYWNRGCNFVFSTNVRYQAYVEDYGWQNEVSDGEVAGTTAEGRRMEALKVNLADPGSGTDICYQAHVENIGWQGEVCGNGQQVGMTGQGLRMEAFRMWLRNPNGKRICYQAHVENIGWQGEVCDGGVAGTTGQKLRVEAVKAHMISSGPPVNNAAFVSQLPLPATVIAGQSYNTSVTMRNTGTTTWTTGDGYKLGSQNPQDNTTWGMGRVPLPGVVAPGQTTTFYFTVAAPARAGTYNFQWRMLREGYEWFGGLTSNVVVQVEPPAPQYEGYLDGADCMTIVGWAWDKNRPNTPVSVDIYDGSTRLATIVADIFRQDLLNARIGNGYHGFSYRLPSGLKDGQPRSILVRYSGTGINLGNSPRSITCWRYVDVTPDSPFYTHIECLSRKGAVGGYEDGTFRPNNTVTRAQYMKMVVLGMGWPLLNPDVPRFTDVPRHHPFYTYIETAAAYGIIGGYADGTFQPDSDITRGQMSKVIVLAGQRKWGWTINLSNAPHFTDVPPGSTFYDYIETAYNLGLISGYSDGNFYPGNNATRGQASKVVSLGSRCN
jgi:hypothetical protein